MSDFSLFSLFTAGLALAGGVGAYTKPKGDAPKGNPISQPGLNSVVPAGKGFTITWEPTTKGSVTLVLLKGPSENAVPQYPIVEKTENDGVYVWTPSTDLEPTADATGYGIQLIDDATGQYQYTTQFGISNAEYDPEEAEETASSAEASASATVEPAGYGHHGEEHGHGHGGWGHGGHNVHGGYSHPAATGTASSSMTSSHTVSSNGTTSAGHAKPTGSYTSKNVTMTQVQPTGYVTSKTAVVNGPSSTVGSGAGSSASAPAPEAPEQTGAAAAMAVSSLGGLVLAAGAAVFAL